MNAKSATSIFFTLITLAALRAPAQETPVAPRTFLVATDGDDSGLGRENLPFKTITHAIETALPGDTITVSPGIYRESLVINNSGTDDKPITIVAQKPGAVIIDGADPVTTWSRDNNAKPIFSSPWDHDFFYSPDVRSHFGPRTDGSSTAIGYAEQFIEAPSKSPEHILKQVINPADLAEGTFCVDYSAHKVSVWLTGSANPADVPVFGSTRSILAAPASAGGSYITFKGLTFRHAANFAQKWAVKTGDGWHMEDCLVERCNAGGLGVSGKDASLLRCTAQDNGQLGLGGSKNTDCRIENCISQRNNYKGFSGGNEAGGGKFSATDNLHILNCIYRDNLGVGLWLDYKNKHYLISGGKFTGNHYPQPRFYGAGIMVEISDGPGKIEDAWFADNTGPAIEIAESMDLTVRNNTFLHTYLDLRDMPKRDPYHLTDLTITGNKFKDTYINTSIGAWPASAPTIKHLMIEANTYDNPPNRPYLTWGKLGPLKSLQDVRTKLKLELSGQSTPLNPKEPTTQP